MIQAIILADVGTTDNTKRGILSDDSSPDPHCLSSEFITTTLKDYKIRQLIAQGGMARVYLAEDIRLQRAVAIKVLKTRQQVHSAVNHTEEGLKEARLLARLNHPNIVQIYDLLAQYDQLALVMEYLKGKSLLQWQQEQVLSLKQKLQWLSQISEGLSAAHQGGVIHCDLKLANVVISDNNMAKIVDFGISQHHGELLNSEQNYGSQASMSPEQLQRQTVDHRSDLFSLGILAWQLIAGHHPFGSGPVAQIARRIVKETPMDARHITPKIPQPLAELLNQLLAKDPAQRPDNSVDVAGRLRQILTAMTQQEILAQDTLPINPANDTDLLLSTSNPGTAALIKNGSVIWRSASILLILLGLLVAGFLADRFSQPRVRQIAVLPPVFTIGDQLAPMQKALLSAAVDDAIRQSIVNRQNMHLISHAEVAALGDGIKQIGRASGADDIITTTLDCNDQRCNVTFSRLGGTDWSVQSRQFWPTAIESFTSVHSSARSYFAALYPEFAADKTRPLLFDEADQQIYLDLYHQVRFKGQGDAAMLRRLKQLLTRSPYLFVGYRLFRETARDLYLQTHDPLFLAELRQLMQTAPPEYRYSVFQAIDAFWVALTLGELSVAKRHMERARQRGADRSTVIELHAIWLQSNNQFEPSIKAFQSALKLRPSTALLYDLALSHWWLSDFAGAKKTLADLLLVTPDHYKANQLLISILLLEGDISGAISGYEKMLTTASAVVTGAQSMDLSNLALAYVLNGQADKALAFAQLAVARSPGHAGWILNLADVQMILGQIAQAQRHYQQVIRLHQGKDDIKSWLERAQALVHTGAASAAIRALNRAKKIAADNGEVAFAAALVYSQLNENVSALAQVEEALAKDIGVVWFNLSWFDGLCQYQAFRRMMIEAGNRQRCLVAF